MVSVSIMENDLAIARQDQMTSKPGFCHLDPKIPRRSNRREAFKILGLQENNEDIVSTCKYL